MAANSKFSVAVHALSVLSYYGSADQPLTSEIVASSVNTNPVVIRRLLSSLKEAGLIESQSGNQGGLKLAKSPDKITLADIYRALEPERFMSIHSNKENKKCDVSRNIKPILDVVIDETENALSGSLQRTTLADLVKKIKGQV